MGQRVYCTQDFIQGIVQYREAGFKDVTANFSTPFFKKANDPKTIKFYEGYFDFKKEQTKSISKSGSEDNLFENTKSTTYSKRVIKFLKCKVGQFAFSRDRNTQIISFKKQDIPRKILIEKKETIKEMHEYNVHKIINDMKKVLYTDHKSSMDEEKASLTDAIPTI